MVDFTRNIEDGRGAPASVSERGEPATGLDLIQTNFRFVYLYNPVLGKWLKVDTKRNRLYKLRRKIFAWANLFSGLDKTREVSYVFQGLTYRPGEHYKPLDISEYIARVKKVVRKNGILGYAWVGEMQKRGEPHYHVLWACEPDVYLPFPDKSGIWSHGSSRVSKRDFMAHRAFYICKYVSKLDQKTDFPKGFRLYGVHVRKGLFDDGDLWAFRMTNYPKWLFKWLCTHGFVGVIPKREVGGGWVVDEKYGVRVGSDWQIETMPNLIDEDRVINP